jgi:CCR4-NOT transcription complex subunit 7/8
VLTLRNLKDTEFPGVVARPLGPFKSQTDFHYQMLRVNVDLLRIIQLGLTFSDKEGRLPAGPATWQFHFQFSLACVPNTWHYIMEDEEFF